MNEKAFTTRMTKRDRIREAGRKHRRLALSVPQIVGSAMAAVTAAVAASYLGVAGTVIGAAVMSLASTVATDVYTHYLKRTGDKVKQHAVSAWQERTTEAGDGEPRRSAQAMALLKALPWAKLAAAAALVFCVSMGGILTYQVIVDQTVADQVTGKSRKRAEPRKSSSKKSRHAESPAPAPYRESVTPTPTGASVSSTPSESPTTRTPMPTPTLTPKPTQSVPEPSELSTSEGTPDVTRQPPAPGQGGPAGSPSATPPGTVHIKLF